jgi:ABC-type sulfate transport system permease subunit
MKRMKRNAERGLRVGTRSIIHGNRRICLRRVRWCLTVLQQANNLIVCSILGGTLFGSLIVVSWYYTSTYSFLDWHLERNRHEYDELCSWTKHQVLSNGPLMILYTEAVFRNGSQYLTVLLFLCARKVFLCGLLENWWHCGLCESFHQGYKDMEWRYSNF